MQTGEPLRPARPRRRCGGFTLLLLLFVLALGGVALASLGGRWQTAAQREREAELIFRGLQIRDAIERYAAAGGGVLPPSLDALLVDRRTEPPRHWLRRLYADPFTGRPDWRLLPGAGDGVQGVASRSERPVLRRHGLPVTLAAGTREPHLVRDWEFIAGTAASPVTTSADPDNENTTPRRSP